MPSGRRAKNFIILNCVKGYSVQAVLPSKSYAPPQGQTLEFDLYGSEKNHHCYPTVVTSLLFNPLHQEQQLHAEQHSDAPKDYL